ncbi:MlaD family protein [Flavobacteriaceae bacterium F08102]|nr:MlaD family protein [Flavobacteriaceae bacterium F08102]
MKKTNSQKTRLGLFVILGTILFIVAVYLIGQRQNMFRKTYTISAYFENVNGLQKGNNVRYSGINIGTVKTVDMVNDSTIKVVMSIEEKIMSFIKKNAVATIGSDGLVGNMIINIAPGDGDAAFIQDGDIIQSFSKIGPDDILSNLSVTIQNTEALTEDLLKITGALKSGGGTLAVLLNDTIMASNLKNSLKDIQVTSQNASSTMKAFSNLVHNFKTDDESILGLLLNDRVMGEKLRTTLNNLENSSSTMKTVLNTANTLVDDIAHSQGAMNYLLRDSLAVHSLKSTLDNIKDGTDKFNQNMEALKHNFLTRGYFRKLEKQQKKNEK